MRFKNLKSSIIDQFNQPEGYKFVPFIVGKPGGGKSSCAREIAEELAKKHHIPAERIVEFNPSLREPSDILGLPDLSGDYSRWIPPKEFYDIRKGQGPSILIIEELSDATMDMQNPLCRVILDRFAGQMPLSEELYIIASGNRTEDKSGASRLSTKLANRMRTLEFTENLDDWILWASAHGVPASIMGFLQWKPMLLSDFDPSRSCNPTPRSWADVARIPSGLPVDVFRDHVAGAVGEGAAAEYTGFLKIMSNLPDFDRIKKNPEKAEIPDDLAVKYAVTCRMAAEATPSSVGNFITYATRIGPEFLILMMRCIGRDKSKAACLETPAYLKTSIEYANAILSVGDNAQ